MFETLDKIMMAGLGAMSMTRERAEKIFDEYVARGQAERGNKSGFVKELMEHAEKARHDMEKLVGDQVHAAIEKMSLATRKDIERLEAKVAEMSAELHRHAELHGEHSTEHPKRAK